MNLTMSKCSLFSYWTVLLFIVVPEVDAEEISKIWLTHKTNAPDRIVVNWMSENPGDSVVHFGLTDDYSKTVRIDENTALHHVEIPLKHRDTVYHYSVSSRAPRSADATFKAYPTDVLRVAVVADWQGKPDLSAMMEDDVHLLLTAGDNIARLWDQCGEGNKDCVKPYADLIDAYPELFRSTPIMPVLGNHDREIRPRGDKPPAEPVYDVDATAFQRFFELPASVTLLSEPRWTDSAITTHRSTARAASIQIRSRSSSPVKTAISC